MARHVLLIPKARSPFNNRDGLDHLCFSNVLKMWTLEC